MVMDDKLLCFIKKFQGHLKFPLNLNKTGITGNDYNDQVTKTNTCVSDGSRLSIGRHQESGNCWVKDEVGWMDNVRKPSHGLKKSFFIGSTSQPSDLFNPTWIVVKHQVSRCYDSSSRQTSQQFGVAQTWKSIESHAMLRVAIRVLYSLQRGGRDSHFSPLPDDPLQVFMTGVKTVLSGFLETLDDRLKVISFDRHFC